MKHINRADVTTLEIFLSCFNLYDNSWCPSPLEKVSASRPCQLYQETYWDCDDDGFDECRRDDLVDSPVCPGYSPTPPPSPTPTPTPTPISTPTPESCPSACSDPSAAFPADECANPEIFGVTDNGCPLGYHRSGCCIVNTCPEPTPTPPICNGTLFWFPAPSCSWLCVSQVPSGGGGGDPIYPENPGGSNCTPYFWVWYISYDNGETWQIADISYAGCW